MTTFDSLLVLGVQLAISLILYFINSKWYYSERVKKIMFGVFVATLILSALSAYGTLQITRGANLIAIAIGNLIYLQIIVQLLSLIIKVVYWIFSKFREKKNKKNNIYLFSNLKIPSQGNGKNLKYSLISIVFIGSIFWIFTRINSLTECELNFIEGTGISKKAYLRIQDEIRVLTIDEIKQIASAIPEGSFENNLRNTAIKSTVYRDCLKESRILNKEEKSALTDSISKYSSIQLKNDSIQLFQIKFLEENSEISSNIDALFALFKIVQKERFYEYEKYESFEAFKSIFLQSSIYRLKEFHKTSKQDGYNGDLLQFKTLMGYPHSKYIDAISDSLDSKYQWNTGVEKLLIDYRKDELELVISDLDLPYYIGD